MNDEIERRQARGIYVGGIGLFMMGVAALVWSGTHVVSSVVLAKEFGNVQRSETMYLTVRTGLRQSRMLCAS